MLQEKWRIQALLLTLAGLALWLGFSSKANSMPGWSRKYRADCTLCHTIYPRLNRTGYEFKRLGDRFPAEVERKQKSTPPRPEPQPSHATTQPAESAYQPVPWSEEAAVGKALAEKFKCATCHQIEGVGGRIGPPLDGVRGRRSWQFIETHIANPTQHAQQYAPDYRLGGEIMPQVPATPEEIQKLAAYLRTLEYRPLAVVTPHPAPGEPGVLNPAYVPAVMTPAAAEGRKLYYSAGCAACHALSGQGGSVGPPLDGVGARRTPVWLMRHVTSPQQHMDVQPGAHETTTSAMPPTDLTPVEIAAIVDFLLTLTPTQEQQAALIPPNRLQDYFATAYLPAVEMERTPEESTNTFEKREINIYVAGTLGPNFSFFAQPTPAAEVDGFLNHFEMIQGLFNYGGTRKFLQVRFGQIFNLTNAGFAGTDRPLTETMPLIFESANGFNPGELARGASVEFTTSGLTTLKAFSVYQSPPEFEVGEGRGEELEDAPEARRSRTYGFAFEKVLGSRGLSGIQFQYAAGYTPVDFGGQVLPSLRFQRYLFFANKTFQDKRNVERLNLIAEVALMRDNRLLDFEEPQQSRGYGFFIEGNWIPVRRLGLLVRFDQFRPTTLLADNTVRAGTAAIICDFTKYTRMLFEYQRREQSVAMNLYRVGWQLNF